MRRIIVGVESFAGPGQVVETVSGVSSRVLRSSATATGLLFEALTLTVAVATLAGSPSMIARLISKESVPTDLDPDV